MDGFLIVSFVPLKNAPQSRRNYQLPNHTQSSTVLRVQKLAQGTRRTIRNGLNDGQNFTNMDLKYIKAAVNPTN